VALRTVGVELVAKVAQYVRGMTDAERATRGVRDEVDKAAKSGPALAAGLEGSGRAAKNAGDDVDAMRRDLSQLDRQILQTRAGLSSLARGFADTADPGVFKALQDEQRKLRQLTTVRKLIGDEGRQAGQAFGEQLNQSLTRLHLRPIDINADPRDALTAIAATEERLRELSRDAATVEVKVRTEQALGELSRFRKSMGDVGVGAGQDMGRSLTGGLEGGLSSLPSLLRGNMIAVAAGLGAVLSPTLGGAIAGAVIGGAAGGGIIGGVMLAARDPRIQQAGKALGQELLADLQSRASVFVQPMYEGIEKIRSRWQSLGPDLDRIFAANRFVSPLIDAAINAAQKITAGIADLVDKADPVMSALAQMVDRVGATTGRTLSLLAGDADEAALAIKDLTDIITGLITATGYIVHATATVRGWIDVSYDAARTAAYWIENNSALSKTLKDVGIQMDITRDAGRRLGGGTFAAAKGMDAAAAAAGGAVGPAVSFTDAMLAAESQMADVERAAYGDRSALVSLSRTMQAQLNPVMALIEAQKHLQEGAGRLESRP
jgi:hypothetical protein